MATHPRLLHVVAAVCLLESSMIALGGAVMMGTFELAAGAGSPLHAPLAWICPVLGAGNAIVLAFGGALLLARGRAIPVWLADVASMVPFSLPSLVGGVVLGAVALSALGIDAALERDHAERSRRRPRSARPLRRHPRHAH